MPLVAAVASGRAERPWTKSMAAENHSRRTGKLDADQSHNYSVWRVARVRGHASVVNAGRNQGRDRTGWARDRVQAELYRIRKLFRTLLRLVSRFHLDISYQNNGSCYAVNTLAALHCSFRCCLPLYSPEDWETGEQFISVKTR
jgi:hypothetical protein